MKITVEQIIGKQVYDIKHEKVGKVSNLYIDETSQQPTWVTVRTGLLTPHENFIPLALASIDTEQDALVVAADKDTVENAPQMESGRELLPDEQDRLYQYYRKIIWRNRQSTMQNQSDDQSSDNIDDDKGSDRSRGGEAEGTSSPEADNSDEDRSSAANVSSDTNAEDATMERSDEALQADGRQQTEAGRARIKKYVVTGPASVTIPLHKKEQLRVTREPITDENREDAINGKDISESGHEVILNQEDAVVENKTVPKERYRADKETATREAKIDDDMRKEKLNLVEEEGQVYE